MRFIPHLVSWIISLSFFSIWRITANLKDIYYCCGLSGCKALLPTAQTRIIITQPEVVFLVHHQHARYPRTLTAAATPIPSYLLCTRLSNQVHFTIYTSFHTRKSEYWKACLWLMLWLTFTILQRLQSSTETYIYFVTSPMNQAA